MHVYTLRAIMMIKVGIDAKNLILCLGNIARFFLILQISDYTA